MIMRVISGGQTGADIAGLRAAKKCGIKTGGAAPVGWMTEKGEKREELESFGMIEHHKPGYRARTMQNIRDSDATLIIGDLTGGSKLTFDMCQRAGKPWDHVAVTDLDKPRMMRSVVQWVRQLHLKVINVAGNRESKAPGIEAQAEEFLVRLFTELKS